MTTRYKDFCTAYDNKQFTDTTVFGVMMVCEKYEPLESHKPIDVEPFVISKTPSAITWLQFRTKGMSDIIEKHLQPKVVDYFSKNVQTVTEKVKAVYLSAKVTETIAVEKPVEVLVKEVVDAKLSLPVVQEQVKPVEIPLTKSEKVAQTLQSMTMESNLQKFRDLKENGIKYMVTYFVINKTTYLGWCEEVS
jgi:hypothetical protein